MKVFAYWGINGSVEVQAFCQNVCICHSVLTQPNLQRIYIAKYIHTNYLMSKHIWLSSSVRSYMKWGKKPY